MKDSPNHDPELGRLRATFYRAKKGETHLASFQSLTDAIEYSSKHDADLYCSDHYENGIATYLVSQSARTKHIEA